MTKIYLDHAATTPVHPAVSVAYIKVLESVFGNPSSIHSFGRESRKWLDEARKNWRSPSMQNRQKLFSLRAVRKQTIPRFSELPWQ